MLGAALLLALAPATTRAQEGKPLFTPHFPPEEFAARRAAVYDSIGPGAIALVQGAPSPMGFVRFRQTNEFFHLSGIESPHAYLMLDGAARTATVYLPPRDERREFGEGKVLSADDAELVRRLSGIDAVRPLDSLPADLRRHAGSASTRTVYLPSAPGEGLSTTRRMAQRVAEDAAADPLDGLVPRERRFRDAVARLLPGWEVRDLIPVLDGIRLIKSPREIALIRESTRLQGEAILEAMRSTEPGVTEAELAAVGKFIFSRHGSQGDAYYALVHSGTNSYFNHFHAGSRALRDGDMVLYDYGPDVGYYASDMGRMWPANGRFSPAQRELYGFYLGFYEAILHRIRPGVTAQQVKREALVAMDSLLARTRFSKPTYAAAERAFVEDYRRSAENPNTTLGHWTGMAAHDPGQSAGPLRPGMVFTIEPQFRVPEERLYFRLEDMILITENGIEIMSDFVPRDIASIERIMRERGILQAYPRLGTSLTKGANHE
jgi:Xaa-Pro aminopeptidase